MKIREHARLNLETLEARATPAAVVSRFDAGLEGWSTVRGDGVGQGATGLRRTAEGYAVATDIQDARSWFWRAPAKFLGDRSDLLGSYLTFDAYQTVTARPKGGNDVFLSGGGVRLAADFQKNPGKAWTSYAVQLTEAGGWKVVGTGRAPTAAEFRAALGGVTELKIRGEYSNRKSSGGLDNVVLGDAAPTATLDSVSRYEAGPRYDHALRFTATLSHITAAPVTLTYATRDGTATAGSDYLGVADGQVTFAAGKLKAKIVITTYGDRVREADETFEVVLGNAVGVGTLRNDD